MSGNERRHAPAYAGIAALPSARTKPADLHSEFAIDGMLGWVPLGTFV